MTTHTAETLPRIKIPFIVTRARVVAFLFLCLIPIQTFGASYVPSRLVVPGDVAATARNIMASETLFRLGIVSALLIFIADIAYVLMLYQLLKPVNRNIAMLMVMLNLLAVPIALLNELNQFAVILLLHGTGSLRAFTPDQLHALVSLFQNLHDIGITIGGIFWGLWLVPYGLLVFKSGFFPRVMGVLLIIECFGFLIQSFVGFLVPGLQASLTLLPAITGWAELFVVLWLLIRGVNVEQWKKLALASA
jgi:hypothetical protein